MLIILALATGIAEAIDCYDGCQTGSIIIGDTEMMLEDTDNPLVCTDDYIKACDAGKNAFIAQIIQKSAVMTSQKHVMLVRMLLLHSSFGYHSLSKCVLLTRNVDCKPLDKKTLNSLFCQKEHTKPPLFKEYEILLIHSLPVPQLFLEIFKTLKFARL